MNEKIKKEKFIGNIFLIIIVSIYLILGIYCIFIFFTDNSKPTYTITKEICENETQYSITMKTLHQEGEITDFRSPSEKFIDSLIPFGFYYDKVNFNVSSKICNGEIDSNFLFNNNGIKTNFYLAFDSEINKSIMILEVNTNLEYSEVCVDDNCKDTSLNETDCKNSIIEIGENKVISLDYEKQTYFTIEEKQTCHQEEVNEIEIFTNECSIEHSYCIENCILQKTNGLIEEKYPDCMTNCNKFCTKNISKEDLTTKWLDENCKCLEKINGCYAECDEKNLFKNETYCCDEINKCSKYQCGEYKVKIE